MKTLLKIIIFIVGIFFGGLVGYSFSGIFEFWTAILLTVLCDIYIGFGIGSFLDSIQ